MSEKILVVDDEPDTLSLLGMTLGRAGYSVVKASDGQMGLEQAIKERPNLIILDMMMPVMSGLDMLRALRTSYEAPLPPVIMFTAKSRVEDVVEGMEAGVYRYLVKPTSREKLLEAVKAALTDVKQ